MKFSNLLTTIVLAISLTSCGTAPVAQIGFSPLGDLRIKAHYGDTIHFAKGVTFKHKAPCGNFVSGTASDCTIDVNSPTATYHFNCAGCPDPVIGMGTEGNGGLYGLSNGPVAGLQLSAYCDGKTAKVDVPTPPSNTAPSYVFFDFQDADSLTVEFTTPTTPNFCAGTTEPSISSDATGYATCKLKSPAPTSAVYNLTLKTGGQTICSAVGLSFQVPH